MWRILTLLLWSSPGANADADVGSSSSSSPKLLCDDPPDETQRIWTRSRRAWRPLVSESESEEATKGSSQPPKRITPPRWGDLLETEREAFTRCGQIPVETSMFVDDANGTEGTWYRYSREYVDEEIRAAGRDASSKKNWAAQALKKAIVTKDARVLVVGSTSPRREALCLWLGAKSTTTLEYNNLEFEHPQMRTATAADFPFQKYARSFDVILADSSLDHDGLGRYGDPIAPDGDLAAMDALRRLLKTNGTMVLSVPVGPDLVAFNLMRIYGKVRLPLLLDGFDRIDTVGFDEAKVVEPVANFRKSYEPFFLLRPNRSKRKKGGAAATDFTQTPTTTTEPSSNTPQSSNNHRYDELRR